MRMIAGALAAAGLAMLATHGSAGSVYKCTAADGKTVFSDKPCAHDAEEITVKDNRIGGDFSPSKQWLEMDKRRPQNTSRPRATAASSSPCAQFSSTELRSYTIRNQVVVGMSVSDALRAWGSPTRINGWQYAYHWNGGGSSYFYVEEGCVSSVDGGYNG